MQNNKNKILVTGGTGKTGNRIVKKLTHNGFDTRIGSRSQANPFDWENENTWKSTLNGISAVYISFQPDLAVPGATEVIKNFVKIAVDEGVQKLVLLSGRGEPQAEACEEVVMNAGIDWTVLRASWFCQNFSEGFMLDSILSGEVRLPVGDIKEPFVDAEDIADVAFEALTTGKHNNTLYELTGPSLLTFKEAITEIASVCGRTILFTEVSLEAYREMLVSLDVPQDYISLLNYLFTEVLDGRNAHITDGVTRALGREATDFHAYAKRNVSAWLQAV
ncbi:NmrA family NAD(P)-binding protein [Pinibacter aurantiacus]|uniref:NAD(P)H-binding protein n=1 Tax=Pinibacter aurantiacus TaxID=2851599 RepID=A0A9E2SDY0_9BACT|nr:NAD(P)H-binding protein [Pinibacter aurantiacus]MBV4359668.1 NAD(P)H-binding protein [Pinibacter aurantiacus]